jgi:hypothetical protein
MRAAVLAGVFVFTASVAVAGPFAAVPASPVTRLMLPSQDRMAAEFARRGSTDTALIDSRESAPPDKQSGLFIQTLQVDTAGDPRPGRRRQILQYRLEGMSVLGGAIGGSLGGRGAILSLQWPWGQ